MDGRSVRWRQHNEGRRSAIVSAAIEMIEDGHEDVGLKNVSERAGLSRSVVYRHFGDRRDLFVAVERRVLDELWQQLEPALSLQGSVRETITGIARAYVDWAVAHPRLHRLVDDESIGAEGPLQEAIDTIAARVGELVTGAFESAGAEVSATDRAASDPLAHGLVAMVFGTVRRWVQLGTSEPDADYMMAIVSDSILALIIARARGYGIKVDPDLPIEALLGGASRPAT